MQKRRRYIIDARFQMRFTLLFILISIAGNILAVTAFNMLAMRKLDAVLWSTHISIGSTDELLRPIFLYVNAASIIVTVLFMIAAGYILMKKTSGPLFRMSRDLEKVTDGDLAARITLRQKDQLRDVADELNMMTEGLQEQFRAIKGDGDAVSSSVSVLSRDAGERDRTDQECRTLLDTLGKMHTKLERFRQKKA